MTSPAKPPRPDDRRPAAAATAFTLIELLLAISILAVLVAVAAPSAGRSFRQMTLRHAGETLAANIRLAQAKAANESITTRVVFDQAAGQYRLEQADRPGGRFEPILEVTLGRTFELPAEVSFAQVELLADDGVSRTGELVFYPDGRGGRGRIVLAGAEGTMELRMTGRLGKVDKILTSEAGR